MGFQRISNDSTKVDLMGSWQCECECGCKVPSMTLANDDCIKLPDSLFERCNGFWTAGLLLTSACRMTVPSAVAEGGYSSTSPTRSNLGFKCRLGLSLGRIKSGSITYSILMTFSVWTNIELPSVTAISVR